MNHPDGIVYRLHRQVLDKPIRRLHTIASQKKKGGVYEESRATAKGVNCLCPVLC